MELVALKPLALGTLEWRTEAGARNLTVIVKATFELVHEAAARVVQPYPLFDDVHYEENLERSLRVASDFAARKPRADVLFTGGVYAPMGERIARREARFSIGRGETAIVDKTVLAVGARDRSPEGIESAPAPFGHLPLRYELAYGGASSRTNPIGMGADSDDPRMPNIVHPDNAKLVAGFGAVPKSWWWRKRALGGTDPLAWLTSSPTIPAAVDLAFFNAAPPDQQVPYLRGDEWIALTGLHPALAQIRSRLPGLRAHAMLELSGHAPAEVKLVADTLWVEGETLRCTVAWRGFLPLEAAAVVADARVLATLAPEGEPPVWAADAPPPPRAPAAFEAPPLAAPLVPAAPRAFAETTIDLELEKPAPTVAKSDTKPRTPPRKTPNIPIVNTTKLHAFTMPWQVKPPQDSIVVIVKGTFAIAVDGTVTLADEQDPPNGDVHFDDDPGASLRYASDFAVFKPAADVTLVGHAHRKRDQEGIAHVELRCGELRRRLAVFGERKWGSMGVEGKPLAFEKMPLRWERAMGGPLSPQNPVGRGFKTGVMLPNIERVDALVKLPEDRPAPACFAPVAPMWKPRRDKLGTYDPAWLKTRWPYMPADFDWSYFNAAPAEQQVPYLRGDERFSLTGFHPERATIDGRLPDLRPRVFSQRSAEAGGDFFEVTLRLDTAWFDADAMKLVLVWRGIFAATDDDAPEIASLFATSDTVKTPLRLEQAQDRFLAHVATNAPAPFDLRAFADEPAPATAPHMAPPPPASRADVLALLAAGASIAKMDLSRVDMRGADLQGKDLAGAVLRGANLEGCNLSGANLAGAVLANARASKATFVGADLTGADLGHANVECADFSKAKLARANLTHCRAEEAVFSDATAEGASFGAAKLSGAKLDRAVLRGADFSYATLDRASFRGAKLDDAKVIEATGEAAVLDGASLQRFRAEAAKLPRCSFAGVHAPSSAWEGADLSGAVFQGAVLTGAIFLRATLEGATLNKVVAKDAVFRRAKLAGARLVKANLMHAIFERADLRGADLRGANLFQAETWRAKTDRADFTTAQLAGTKLAAPRGEPGSGKASEKDT